MFARYGEGMFYGSHNDAPVTHFHPTPARADVSFTIFLNDPSAYDGGELVLESPLGDRGQGAARHNRPVRRGVEASGREDHGRNLLGDGGLTRELGA